MASSKSRDHAQKVAKSKKKRPMYGPAELHGTHNKRGHACKSGKALNGRCVPPKRDYTKRKRTYKKTERVMPMQCASKRRYVGSGRCLSAKQNAARKARKK